MQAERLLRRIHTDQAIDHKSWKKGHGLDRQGEGYIHEKSGEANSPDRIRGGASVGGGPEYG